MKKEIDRKLLAALRAREPQGLEEAIGRYSPYVAGVLRKVLGPVSYTHLSCESIGIPPIAK